MDSAQSKPSVDAPSGAITKAAASYAPGPWFLEFHAPYQDQDHLTGAWVVTDKVLVAEVRGAVLIRGAEHRQNMANARLIAAAPNLAALAYAIREAADLAGTTLRGPLARMADDAIAKLEGR